MAARLPQMASLLTRVSHGAKFARPVTVLPNRSLAFFSKKNAGEGESTNDAKTKVEPAAKEEKVKSAESPKAESSEPTGPYAMLAKLASALKSEVDTSVHGRKATPYQAPKKLTRDTKVAAPIEINDSETGVVLHKSSKWATAWNNLRDNNPLVNKWFEWKMKYDESDNLLIRVSRSVTDTVATNVAGVFEKGEMAETIAEIAKVDPNFDLTEFLVYVEKSLLPPVLEAFYRGDSEALKGWCSADSFGVFEAQIQQQKDAGVRIDYKILDIRNVDLAIAKVLDDAPVLILTFSAHQIICVRDKAGAIKEGSEDDVQNAFYVVALRRNPQNFDPHQAWEVMELAQQASASSW